MSTVSPSIDFNQEQYLENLETPYIYQSPLTYDSYTKTLSVNDVSTTSDGVLTTGTQSISGTKTFINGAKSNVLPSASSDLTTKGYVDNLASTNLSWKDSVISFYQMSTPPAAVVGDRYIAISTTGSFVKDYIYEWSGGSVWVETAVSEGVATYVSGNESPCFANQCIYYNETAWVNFSATMTHQSLAGSGILTHATIDSYLNQGVKTSSSPQFAKLTITDNTEGSSTSTGALSVSGGIGVYGNSYFSRTVILTGGTQAVTTNSGILQVTGGMGVGGNMIVGQTIQGFVQNESTSTNTGGLIVGGGAGIAKSIYVGGSINYGSITSSDVGGITQEGRYGNFAFKTGATNSNFWSMVNSTGADIIQVLNKGQFRVCSTTQSSDTLSGSLIVSGGASIAKNLYVSTNISSTTATSSYNMSGIIYLASFQRSIRADYGADLCVSQNGGVYIEYGQLQLLSYANKYVTFNASTNLSSMTQTGTIIFYFQKGYTGAPTTSQFFISMGSGTGAVNNLLEIYQEASSGIIVVSMNDSAGNTILNTSFGIMPTGTGIYSFVMTYDCNTGGVTKLYVNGNQMGSSVASGGYTRTGDLGTAYIGATARNATNSRSNVRLGAYAFYASVKPEAVKSPDLCTNGYFTNAYGNTSYGKSYMHQLLIDGDLSCTNTTASTDTSTGALLVSGGVGIGGNLSYNTISGTHSSAVAIEGVYGNMGFKTTAPNTSVWGISEIVGGKGLFSVCKNGQVNVCATTPSGATSTGSLIVNGGVGIGGNVYTGGEIHIQSATPTTTTNVGALVVSGGIGVGGRINATNMTCLTAPSSDTDVVRLGDISGISVYHTDTLPMAMSGTGISFPDYTVKCVRVLDMVTMMFHSYTRTSTESGNFFASDMNSVTVNYRPNGKVEIPAIVDYAGAIVRCFVVIDINQNNVQFLCSEVPWTGTVNVTIPTFSITYQAANDWV